MFCGCILSLTILFGPKMSLWLLMIGIKQMPFENNWGINVIFQSNNELQIQFNALVALASKDCIVLGESVSRTQLWASFIPLIEIDFTREKRELSIYTYT